MTAKYKILRIPIDAYERDKRKADEISQRLKEIQKSSKKVKMTDYFRFRSKRPMFIYDDELVKAFGKSRRRCSLI